MKRIRNWLARGWFPLASVLVATILLAGSGVQLTDRVNIEQDQFVIGIGQKVITLGHVAYAAGEVDYIYDGVDDNIQFQAALDALPATGGRLINVSAVQLNFSATVTRAIPNVIIEGAGRGTYFTNNGVATLFTAGSNNWKFIDLRTDAGGLNMGATTGWEWQNVTIDTDYYAYRTPIASTSGADWGIPTGRGTTLYVAASNASAASIAQADYVADGVNDEVQIQAALDALSAGVGGRVVLSEGRFVTDIAITFPDTGYYRSIILEGQGMRATTIANTGTGNVLELVDLTRTDSKASYGNVVRDLQLYGNRSGGDIGLYLNYVHDNYFENILILHSSIALVIEGHSITNTFVNISTWTAGGGKAALQNNAGIYMNDAVATTFINCRIVHTVGPAFEAVSGTHAVFYTGQLGTSGDGASLVLTDISRFRFTQVYFEAEGTLTNTDLVVFEGSATLPAPLVIDVTSSRTTFRDSRQYPVSFTDSSTSTVHENPYWQHIDALENTLLSGDAEELVDVTASNGNAVRLYGDEAVAYFQTGASVRPNYAPGHYGVLLRLRETSQITDDIRILIINWTDSTIKVSDYIIVSDEGYADYGYEFDIDSDDIGDDIRIAIYKKTAGANSIYIDYLKIFGPDTVQQRSYQDIFMDVLAVSATAIRSNEDLSAGISITFTIDAQPDVPRTLSGHFDTHANITAYTLDFTGINGKGGIVTESITEADGWDWETSNAFAVITSIKMSARTGTGVGDTMDIGITDVLGLSNRVLAPGDVYKIKKNNADATVAVAQIDTTYHTYDMSVIGLGAADDFTIWFRSNLYLLF